MQASRPGSRRPDMATAWAGFSITKRARTYSLNTERIRSLGGRVKRRTSAGEDGHGTKAFRNWTNPESQIRNPKSQIGRVQFTFSDFGFEILDSSNFKMP